MTNTQDSFATHIGCMDGRVQKVVADFAKEKFGADFPDTITEPGLDGLLPKFEMNGDDMDNLKFKISISVDKHKSRGIVVSGHEDCAGNPVSEEQHKEDIKKCVGIVKELVAEKNIPVVGVYVAVNPSPKVAEIK